jgi:hypothetical protein
MRDDALFRAEVTFPFSSETSTLVDSPGAQVDITGPSIPKAESNEGLVVEDREAWSTPNVSTPGTNDVSDPMDLGEDIMRAKELQKGGISSQEIGSPSITSASSTVQPPSVKDQIPDLSSTPIRSMTPVKSKTETLREDSDSEEPSPLNAHKLHIWFGDLARLGFDDPYLSLRDQLADEAYIGDFDRMFYVLAEAQRTYRQSWANAPRLST